MFSKGTVIELEAESISGQTSHADLIMSNDKGLYDLLDDLRRIGKASMWKRYRIKSGLHAGNRWGGWHYC